MTIPLVRTRYLLDQVRGYERIGGDADRLLRRVGVPLEVLESPESLLPLAQYEAFSRLALDDAGLALARATSPQRLADLGAFGARLSRERTLYAALKTFIAAVKAEATRVQYSCDVRTSALWLCWQHDPGEGSMQVYSERFSIGLLLSIIRHWAGPEWLPQELWVRSIPSLDDEELQPIQRVRYRAPLSAIAISKDVLSRTVDAPPSSSAVHETVDLSAIDLVDATSRVLQTYLASGHPSVVTLGEALGMSTRSLQRRLSEAGTTHSRLLDDVRRRLALARLEQCDHPIHAIAQDLGYSDSAHFTRAFRRWTGLAPREFRSLRRRAHERPE